STKPLGKKYVARARQEEETRRKVLLAVAAVGGLVLLVLIIGLVRTFFFIPRQPVAIVEGTEISTADYRKRFLYEQYFIDQQITRLQDQFGQISGAFADNPELQQQLQQQTAQQLQQLSFQKSELPGIIFDTVVEEELIRQEASRRAITVSSDEIDNVYNARAAQDVGGYTTIDASSTVTAQAIASENATATAENITPTPTLTPTDEMTTTETVELPATPVPQPTPTIVVIEGEALNQAKADWEAGFQAEANMGAEDLRQIIEAELLRERLIEAFSEEAETTALQTNARHILVATQEEAISVTNRLAAGELFTDLAAEVSQDPGSGANGGDLGWFARDAMVAPFAEAAFSQEVGVIGEPVETQFGWHVIEVLEREERDLDEAALARAQRAAYDTWLSNARVGNIEDLRTPDSVPFSFGQ
ncbi:MAG: peptidylprolyl isomerase, partial [Chloroflexota bacterium]